MGIWVNIGDDYLDVEFDDETPCKVGKTLVLLKDVKKKNGHFYIWHSGWSSAFLSNSSYHNGTLKLELKGDKITIDQVTQLVEVISDRLNDKEFLSSTNLEHIFVALKTLGIY